VQSFLEVWDGVVHALERALLLAAAAESFDAVSQLRVISKRAVASIPSVFLQSLRFRLATKPTELKLVLQYSQ
jgi:hypothetical protein